MTHPNAKKAIACAIFKWYRANARDLPWRRTQDPYAVWISEVMLQQTQVKTVIPYWNRWMLAFPTIRDLATADEQHILKLWEGLGYYTRARNLQKAARIICEQHGGMFPREFSDVLSLPGIGRYTAGAICSIGYGQPTAILDGNVMRVLSRLFAIPGDPKGKSNQQQLWALSASLVSAAALSGKCSELNQGLMELGATVCVPRDPLCPKCPVRSRCAAFQSQRVADFPEPSPRKKSVQRRFTAFILRHGEKVLVRQRPSDGVNGNLWEFPNHELKRGIKPLVAKWQDLKVRPFATVKHTITTNRITLRASTAEVNGDAAALAAECSAEWRCVDEIAALPFTSAHSKLREMLLKTSQSAA